MFCTENLELIDRPHRVFTTSNGTLLAKFYCKVSPVKAGAIILMYRDQTGSTPFQA